MKLVQESVLSNTVGENVLRLKALNDEIKGLSDLITEYKNSKDCTNVETTMSELAETLYSELDQNDAYDDDLVRQLIGTIKVMEDDKLLIIF